MNRRNFFQYTASSFLLPVMLDGYGARAFSRESAMVQALMDMNLMDLTDNADRILVAIQLNGGNDGLNMVIPLDQMSKYQSLRSNIAIAESKVLKLNGNTTTGLHPSMSGLQRLYNEGKLSVVQGVSYANPNFSHFRASDIWYTAVDATQTATTGWMGRYMDSRFPNYPDNYPNATMPDPLAIQIGAIASTALLGDNQSVAVAIQDPNTFAQLVGDKPFLAPGDLPNTYSGKQVAFVREQQVSSVAYAAQLKTAATKGVNQVTYPTGNSLADQLKIVARLIHGGLQTKIYYVSLGGFDTHANQATASDTSTGTHATLLKYISDAIAIFQDDLKAMKVEDKVVGMTFSEFGRRAVSNASLGTDHGWAAPMFVFGSAIKTAMIGKSPNLSDLDNNNIKIQYDFRQVYASILSDWFGASSATQKNVLFKDFATLPIFKATVTAIEPLSGESLLMYPNPVSDILMVEHPALQQSIYSIGITDMTGKAFQVGKERTNDNQFSINVSNLPAGQYILQIETETQYLSGKIMVIR